MLTAFAHDKHVYGQKPLVHQLEELVFMERALSQKPDLVTQLGNQHSSGQGDRMGVEWVRSGVIGKVREVHVWSNRPIWPQGIDRPQGEDDVPAGLDRTRALARKSGARRHPGAGDPLQRRHVDTG